MPAQQRIAWVGFGILILMGAGVGCGGTRPVVVDAYEKGGPAFVLEAIPVLREQRSGLELYLGLRPRTLVFTHVDTAYRATYEVLVRLLDAKGRVRYERAFDDTLRVPTFAATRTHVLHLWHRFVPYRPGQYRLEVTVIDRNSRQYTTRRRPVRLPDPFGRGPMLSPVWLERRTAVGRYAVYPGRHFAAGVDSLRAAIALFRLRPEHRVQVRWLLLHFPVDTSAARPPYDLMPVPGSLSYLGDWYDRPDTLQVSTRRLEGLSGRVRIDFMLPPLVARGVYRVEVIARIEGQARRIIRQRELAVHGPTFPQVGTLDQMVEALVYLASPDEWAQLQAARTPAQLRARFDAFWGRWVSDRRKAAWLLRRYYERIEQANLQFSSIKEGWRTDRGMV
ncbi:MAG: GWxTD domain-containing protein, partial [Rhodothermus sp.]|nr:GWxTD domain-containing protein [Rhodothermus sp.]